MSANVNVPTAKSGKFEQEFEPTVIECKDGFALDASGELVAVANLRKSLSERVDATTALRNEVLRCAIARSQRLALEAVIREQFSPRTAPVEHGKSLKLSRSKTNKSSPPLDKISTGLFPAIVFEYISARSATVEDPLLFAESTFPDGVSASVAKRLTPFVHDLKRITEAAALKAECELISRRVVCAMIDAMRKVRAEEADKNPSPNDALTVTVSEVNGGKHSVLALSCDPALNKHVILQSHLQKLKRMYRGPDNEFEARCFVMLHRYYALTGAAEDPSVEAGWHGAVPCCFIEGLVREFGTLAGECFASPLNATCDTFCSAFPDVDCHFGSIGSFFNVAFASGIFEANPPFDHSLAVAMGKQMRLLLSSHQPLAFVVIVPTSDTGKQLQSSLELNETIREVTTSELVLKSLDAIFVDGHQQCIENTFFTSRLDTKVSLLQNEAHRVKFPDAADRIARAVTAWKVAQQLGKGKRAREEVPEET